MRKHTDCEDRCQILEHKGYHDCTNTGRCELLEAMTTPTPDEALARLGIGPWNFIKKLAHDYLGWHKPKRGAIGFDGCSLTATCLYCGNTILQDSQGNWFTLTVKDKL